MPRKASSPPAEEWDAGKIAMVVIGLVVGCVMAMPHCNSDGHYDGGEGSSHKVGHYKNDATGDHYRKR